VLLAFAEQLAVALNPTKRVFGPFLAGAAVLAAAVWFFTLRRRVSLLGYLFPRRLWLHPSTLLDLRLLLFRTALEGVLVAPFAVPVTAGALALARLGWEHLGIVPTTLDLGRATVTALFSVSAFCAEDLSRYLVHRLAHRVPALWELHKVHHSAEVLTPLTVYRTHPVESVLMRAGAAGAITLTAALFVWAFPGKVAAWEIGGVYALSFAWNVLGANLRHSHVWLPYPAWLQRLFISPAQHQLHHSTDPNLHHANFGSALAVWDLLGGSLRLAGPRPHGLAFGLPPAEQNHRRTVRSVLWRPLAAALKRLAGLPLAPPPPATRAP
jgi:sterol desaturase/sphingolipid hydroxylase (fatty acid hydroxylase superfamily)